MKRNAKRMLEETVNERVAVACDDARRAIDKMSSCLWDLKRSYGGREHRIHTLQRFLDEETTQTPRKPDTKRRAAEMRKLPESVLERFYWVGNKTARVRILRDIKRDDPFAKSIIGRHTADVAEEILFQHNRADNRLSVRAGCAAVDLVTPMETIINKAMAQTIAEKLIRVKSKKEGRLDWPDHTIVLP